MTRRINDCVQGYRNVIPCIFHLGIHISEEETCTGCGSRPYDEVYFSVAA